MRVAKGSNQNILVRDNGVDDEVSFNVGSFATYQSRVDNVMLADGESWTQERYDAFEVGMSVGQTRKDPGILHVVVSVAYRSIADEPELPPDSEPEPSFIPALSASVINQSVGIPWMW